MKEKIRLYVNSTKTYAKELAEQVKKELIKRKYKIVEDNEDIVIGFGGDGTLLHFLRENDYETCAKYVGVNCGTLGFMQDFNVKDASLFVENLPTYVEQTLRFIALELEVNGEKTSYKALNEFVIQDDCNKSFRTAMSVGEEFLENFVGTGLIFATPIGSTALNLSAGGCIVHPDIQTIQITPREAIANSKMHCLAKSICVPGNFDIILKPNNDECIKIISDGEVIYMGVYNSIRIYYSNDNMIKLRDRKDNFVKTIREKLI